MRPQELNALKDWFRSYTRTYFSENTEDQRNLSLKVEHTYQVCRNIVFIAESVPLAPEEVLIAESVGLFHDVGRFPQYARYKTFRDSISVNHGKLGAETLEAQQVLEALSAQEQGLILYCVRFHNAFSLPKVPDEQHRCFLRLIRDADKVDIWRVFSEYFEQPDGERASAAGLGLPDLPDCSEKILSCLLDGRSASLADIRTLNDFRLLQLSWVFDLNFRASFILLHEKGDLYKIGSALPQTGEILQAVSHVHAFIEARAAGAAED